MVFDPNAFKPTKSKRLPVVLLLDVSGSMSYDNKIESLYRAVQDMVAAFAGMKKKERIMDVAIITFGENVDLHTKYTPAEDLARTKITPFDADGMTPMGTALRMAKDMIEDKSVTPSPSYKPAVVLVSDGQPNDSWREPMENFINDGRSAKCQRFAVAIGRDADRGILEMFTQDPSMVLFAEDAEELVDKFKFITTTIKDKATVYTNGKKDSPAPSNLPYDDDKKDKILDPVYYDPDDDDGFN